VPYFSRVLVRDTLSTCNVDQRYFVNIFEPFGVETLGSWGPSVLSLFKEIAKRLVDALRDQRVCSFLAQIISIAIQCGNAASL
jgi:hypothetical protein